MSDYVAGNGDATIGAASTEIEFEFFTSGWVQPGVALGLNNDEIAYWNPSSGYWEGSGTLISINAASPPLGGRLQLGTTSGFSTTSPQIMRPLGAADTVMDFVYGTDPNNGFMQFYRRVQGEMGFGARIASVNTDMLLFTLSNDVLIEHATTFRIGERAAASADLATYGQLWVNSADDSLNYQTEAGVNFDLTAGGGGTIGGTIANNQVAVGNGADAIDGSAAFTFDGSTLFLSDAVTLSLDSNTGDRIIVHTGGYSIGIEANTLYFNSNSEFDWYTGGGGGTLLMNLTGVQLEVIGHIRATGTGHDVSSALGNINALDGSFSCGTDDGEGYWMEGVIQGDYGMYLSAVGDATFGGRPLGDSNSDLNTYFTTDNGTNRGFVFKTAGTGNAASGMTFSINPTHGLLSRVPLMMLERAAALSDVSTMGQTWVRTDTFSNTLMFTNDNGNDFEVAGIPLGGDVLDGTLLLATTSFVGVVNIGPKPDSFYMLQYTAMVFAPAADDIKVELTVDTNSLFIGTLTDSTGQVVAIWSPIGSVVTNTVVINTDGTALPNGQIFTIQGHLHTGATAPGTMSLRAAKNADTGADGSIYFASVAVTPMYDA